MSIYMSPLQLVTFYGRVIAVSEKTTKTDKSFVNVTISSPINRKKKPDEDYPPSNLYQFTLWNNNKYAAAVIPLLAKNVNVIVVGELGQPRTYEKNGQTQVVLTIENIVTISVVREEESTNYAKSNASKPSASSKKSKYEDLSELLEEEDDTSTNFDDDLPF